MRIVQVLIALVLALNLGVGLAGAQEGDSYDGIWFSQEEGIIVEINGTKADLWEQTAEGDCVQVIEFDLDGNRVLAQGEEVYTVHLEDGMLVVEEHNIPQLTLEPISSLDAVCLDPGEQAFGVDTGSITTLADINRVLNEIVTEAQIPGVAVALVKPGEVVWSGGYGYANVENGLPVTPDTPFKLASVTKLFTGTALMHAVQDGLLTLDTPINNLLPFVVDNPHVEGEVITVRHLVTHTSGLLDDLDTYLSVYTTSGDSPISLGDFLEGYLVPGGEWYDADRNYANLMPGITHEYSNVGAALAGYIVERATGMPLDEYAQTFLFGPLGMAHTGWHLADFVDPAIIAVPYEDSVKPLGQYGNPTWPAGQLRSSANDVARFLAAIMNGGEIDGVRILDEATVEQMLQPALPAAYADIGVFWLLNYPGPGMIGHTGGDPGVMTLLFFHPETQVGFVMLFNSDSTQAGLVANTILQTLAAHLDILMQNG